MPVASGQDEPAHIYRGISLWEGQFLPSARSEGGQWLVQIPSSVVMYAESTACFRWKPQVSAGCVRPLEVPGDVTTVKTGAGRYFPPYYYAVGWVGRADQGVTGFYAMRALSLVVSSVLLGLAIVTVLRTIGARWSGLVLPIAITPQVLWLGSAVNPNAWEVDAGILTWAAGLALVSRLGAERREALWAKFLLGGSVLLVMRRLSPLWLVLIVAGVLAVRLCLPLAERRSLRSLASRRAAVVAGVLVCLAALSAWWHLTYDLAYVSRTETPGVPHGFANTLKTVLPDIPWWIGQTYGVFGWLDTASPPFAALVWMGLGSGTLALVVLSARYRLRVALTVGLGIVLWAAVPLAFVVTAGPEIGVHFWQARYTMPFGQGIPLALGVLGAACRGRPPELEKLLRWASPAAAWLMWPVLGTLTLVWALHRFARGEGADWSLADLQWSPPGGIAVLVAFYAVAGVALVRSLRDGGNTRRSSGSGRQLAAGRETMVDAGVGTVETT
jgi:hypothetical protein